jgi:hypothetical protein
VKSCQEKSLVYLGFCGQLTMFLIELYMFLSNGGKFIFFILFACLLTPPNIPFFSNMSVEVFDAVLQLLVSVL